MSAASCGYPDRATESICGNVCFLLNVPFGCIETRFSLF
jgi:hypothetical protein